MGGHGRSLMFGIDFQRALWENAQNALKQIPFALVSTTLRLLGLTLAAALALARDFTKFARAKIVAASILISDGLPIW